MHAPFSFPYNTRRSPTIAAAAAAEMSIRKAIGAVKDRTTIGIAKVTASSSSISSPNLDVAVVRATSHHDAPDDARHAAEVLRLSHPLSSGSAAASVMRRLARTRDYVVAVKCLVLVHRLVVEGPPRFRHEILRPTTMISAGSRRGGGDPVPILATLVDFRDEAHHASWEYSAFVRAYAAYLDATVRFLVDAENDQIAAASSPPPIATVVHETDTDSLLSRARDLRHLMDRLLACRPSSSTTTSSRVVLAALRPIRDDSFRIHADVAAVLAVLLDRFFEMEYGHCVKAFEAYVGAAKQVDELLAFHAWCKDVGLARASSDFPEINRIDDGILETLEQLLRDRGRAGAQTPLRSIVQDDHQLSASAAAAADEYDAMNGIKVLLPASPAAEKKAAVAEKAPDHENSGGDQLVDLREPSSTADEQGNMLALALFNAPPPPTKNGDDWVAFSSSDVDAATPDQQAANTAWQTPAAEPGKADWELALVDTASTLSRQAPALGGGLDPLLLGGMYDHGAVRHDVASGSASSVALPAPVPALPAPVDGTVGGGDPFAASLAVPPPSYVQMAEMERKQQLLMQEQQMWARYRQGGMQGQVAAPGSVFATNTSAPMMADGLPPMAYNQVGGGYYF